MHTFKVGDEVQHLASPQKLIVQSLDGDNVTCVGSDLKSRVFPAAMLKPYTRPQTTVRYATFRKGF